MSITACRSSFFSETADDTLCFAASKSTLFAPPTGGPTGAVTERRQMTLQDTHWEKNILSKYASMIAWVIALYKCNDIKFKFHCCMWAQCWFLCHQHHIPAVQWWKQLYLILQCSPDYRIITYPDCDKMGNTYNKRPLAVCAFSVSQCWGLLLSCPYTSYCARYLLYQCPRLVLLHVICLQ